jgi:hypothetical protein
MFVGGPRQFFGVFEIRVRRTIRGGWRIFRRSFSSLRVKPCALDDNFQEKDGHGPCGLARGGKAIAEMSS